MMKKIILEGTDLIGKSTAARILNGLNLPVEDRSTKISREISLDSNLEEITSNVKKILSKEYSSDLVFFLIANDEKIISKRKEARRNLDKYDLHAEKYNEIYSAISKKINSIKNIYIDNKSPFEIVSQIVVEYVKNNLDEFDLKNPAIEGESKKFYAWKNLALVELKPTMYSFTHNRYGVVEKTDNIRLKFWELFGKMLNSNTSNHMFNIKKDTLFDAELETIISDDVPFISNYLGTINVNGVGYAITRFADSIPPIEVVWKKYLVGTMKHNLKVVDEFKTKYGQPVSYEGKFPKSFIRFDWRNPLPDKDECIPEDFADIYTDSYVAKKVATLSSLMLDRMLKNKGYELVDLCYFINQAGDMIHSEITPDGMRIKKKEKSFDKDLWRQGKDKDTIVKVWNKLYVDLK